MRLYLIRHAHTQQDRKKEAGQWQLSAQGVAQAQQLAYQPFWAEVSRIVVSSEPKTRLTIEPVLAQRSLPIQIDARLDELRRTGYVSDEEYLAQVQQTFSAPDQTINGWEPAAQAQQRMLTAIAELGAQFTSENIALVGHGLTLSLYRAHLLGQRTVRFKDWQHLPFAAVALVDPINKRLLQDFRA